jgi:hypothetical protein
MNDQTQLPSWFKVLAGVAIVWNLIGIMMFVAQMLMTPEMLAALPEAEQALYTAIPMWVTIAFACAVFGGTAGSILLLLRKALAFPIFVISAIGVAVQTFHSFFIIDAYEVYGPEGLIIPTVVLVIALVLVFVANKSKGNGWIS